MKAGIKIGLRDYKDRIPQTQAKICEIYFRIDQKAQYGALFSMLKDKKIEAGLHFWAMLDSGLLYNLAYPDAKIQEETLSLIKETIDIAAQNNLRYVNVHPGNAQLVKVNLDIQYFEVLPDRVDLDESKKALFANIKTLSDYASSRNVLFLTETVPSAYNHKWYDENTRLMPIRLGDPKVSTLIELSRNGYFITNDLSHTTADEVSDDRDYLFKRLYSKTQALAKQTKLIHVNTTRSPFNGTDTHNGILPFDFAQNAFPSLEQLKQLLKLFSKRNDVWLIPEPLQKHEENFQILDKIIKDLEK